ncbi:STAS domain-containing protein [Streptomyces sp. NPDC050400]|uniref:STAS domain-containing protein n=1 Tax=Streptomyces sp. NPDC050400 TaxID=3365610 RepID=UPI00378EBB27
MTPTDPGAVPDDPAASDGPDGPHTVLALATSAGPDGPLVTLTGDLDYETAPRLLESVAALDAPAGTTVTLDLSGVGFFDSGGINALLRARTSLRNRDADLTVRRLSPVVERIFRITGLDTVLTPGTSGDGEDPTGG